MGNSSGNTINGTVTGTGYSWVAGSPFNAEVNLAPDAPVLVAPANGASNVPTTAALSVTVSDPETQPLDVTFYGRPLQAAAGPDFTIIAIPDPQYYASTYPSIYDAQMQWVKDNKTAENIVYVASLGDNVDVASNTTHWTNADHAWDILDAVDTWLGVPYGLTAGNHDGAPSNTGNFNTYFGESRFTDKPWVHGHYGSDNDNHFALFEASGLQFIIVFLEYDDTMTNTSHPVLVWANNLLQNTYSSRRAIVVSHNMLSGNNFSTQGQTIYNALKANPNLFLMLGGHLDVAGQRSDTYLGNTVYTLRSDYQSVDSQQSGYLRIMRFSPSDDMIYVRTYSPTQNKDYDKSDAAQNNFNLPYAMDGTGFSVIGTADNVASGGTASVDWAGLDPAGQYEWFVIASDGTHQTSSDTWNFTTAGDNAAPVITEGASTNVSMSEDSSPTAFSLTLNATDANPGDTLTWSISTQATNGTAAVTGTGTSKAIGYAPTSDYNGSDSFVVQVSDGTLADTITVNVTINAVNDAPVAVDDAYSVAQNGALSVPEPGVLGNDTDIENDPLTAVKVTDPANGALTLNSNGSFTYTPNSCYVGSDAFTYKANNGATDSNTATVNLTVNMNNQAPNANAGGSYTADLGNGLTLDGSASMDPNSACGDSIVSYEWDLNDDGTYELTGPTAISAVSAAQVNALGLGSHPIRLRVTDEYGLSDTADTTLAIYDNTPVADFTAVPNPAACGSSISFDASASTHGRPDRSIVSYNWDFGDTQIGTGLTPTHTYSAFGSYTATLTVTDDNVPAKTDTHTLTVNVNQGNQAPNANAGGPYTCRPRQWDRSQWNRLIRSERRLWRFDCFLSMAGRRHDKPDRPNTVAHCSAGQYIGSRFASGPFDRH